MAQRPVGGGQVGIAGLAAATGGGVGADPQPGRHIHGLFQGMPTCLCHLAVAGGAGQLASQLLRARAWRLAARSAMTCMRRREARRPATSAAARNRNTVITPWRAPMAKVKRGAMNRKL